MKLFIRWVGIDCNRAEELNDIQFDSTEKKKLFLFEFGKGANDRRKNEICSNLQLARSRQTFPWKCAPCPDSSWMLHIHPHGISIDSGNLDSVQSYNHGQMHRLSSNLRVQDSYNFRWCGDTNWCIRLAECHFFLQSAVGKGREKGKFRFVINLGKLPFSWLVFTCTNTFNGSAFAHFEFNKSANLMLSTVSTM